MKRLTALILLLVLINSCALCESDAAIWDLPNKSQALHEDMGRINTTKVTQITGQTSTNKTMSRFGVWGTDLGSMTEMNGKVYMFCGDTFSTADYHDWRSNVLLIIEDDDPSDGLTITGAITDNSGAKSPMEGGTNIPEDSNGVITDPVTDDMRGDSDNSTEQSEGMTTRPDTTRADTTVTGTATDTQENAPADDEGGNGFVGVIVAVIIAIAVILLIIALMPRKRIE